MKTSGWRYRAARCIASSLAALVGLGLVACGDDGGASAHDPGDWVTVHTRAELDATLDRLQAEADGKPVVVQLWATWAKRSQDYDALLASDADLGKALRDFHRIRLDVTEDIDQARLPRLGKTTQSMPWFGFIDVRGEVREDLQIPGWLGPDSASRLKASLAAAAKP